MKNPGAYVWCTFQGEKPFKLTYNGGLIAQGHYTGCSTPVPDKCRAQVDLQRLKAYDGHWHAVKNKDSGWTKCSGRVTTKPLKCVHDGHKETYNTQVTLQVEYHGHFSETGIADSGDTYVDCRRRSPMEFAFEALDLEHIRRFWSLVPRMDGLTISQGPVSSMRPVTSPLVGTVQELAETLTDMGGRVLEWDEGGWALMTDPEGNEFYVRPPEDL
ncbi:hypothetical protein [Streptomyces collinus]|uniref:hypothetical protein n=1 Tax=Streptomyces collinus TaxID=42684 RepID=UPI003674EBB5